MKLQKVGETVAPFLHKFKYVSPKQCQELSIQYKYSERKLGHSTPKKYQHKDVSMICNQNLTLTSWTRKS